MNYLLEFYGQTMEMVIDKQWKQLIMENKMQKQPYFRSDMKAAGG